MRTSKFFPVIALFLMLGLTGCFEADRSIISDGSATPLPGGPGIFLTKDKESGEEKTLQITKRAGDGEIYLVSGKDKDGEFESNVKLLHTAGKHYVVQIHTPKDNSYMIFAAQIDAKSIALVELDNQDFKTILQSADIPIIKKVAFGNNDGKNALIAKLKAAKETYAVDMFGFKLYGDTDKILSVAKEMARVADYSAGAQTISLIRK